MLADQWLNGTQATVQSRNFGAPLKQGCAQMSRDHPNHDAMFDSFCQCPPTLGVQNDIQNGHVPWKKDVFYFGGANPCTHKYYVHTFMCSIDSMPASLSINLH